MIPNKIKNQLLWLGHAVHEEGWFVWDTSDDGTELSLYTCPCCGKILSANGDNFNNAGYCIVTPKFREVLEQLPGLFNEIYSKGVTDGSNQVPKHQADYISRLTLAMSYVIREFVDPDWGDIRMEDN